MYIVGHNGDGGSTQAQGGGGRRGGIPNGYTPVSAVTATLGDMPVYLDALGTVTPTATVTVRSQINGVLQSVAFTEGQMVQKGQFLAQVDPRPYQAALLQAQGALAKDQATLTAAKKDLERYKTLVAQDSISQQTLDTQVSTVGQLEGTVQSDQAAVQTQQLNLIYAHITAPMAGRVGLRQVDPGNFVTSGDSNGIVAITGESPIDVAFTIPEDQVQTVIGRFSGGKTKLPVSVMDRTQAKVLATGTLLSLDNLIDTTTGTLRAKARFANTDGALFPSQFVNVRVLVDTLHNVVVVPSSAILRGQSGLFVYTANARGAVHVTPVTTGPTDGDNTAILSGVSPGQQVVTDGTDRLREGACVVVPSAQGGAGSFGAHRHGGASGTSGAGSSVTADAPKEGFFGHLFGGASSSAAAGAKAASPCGGGSGGHHHAGGAGDATAPAGGEAATSGGPATSGAAEGSAGGWHHSASGGQAGGQTDTGAPTGVAPAASGTAAAGEGGGHGNAGGGQAGGGQGGGGRMAALLQQLNLTPDQQAKATAIMAQARTQAQAADDPDAKRQIFMASQQQIQAILTPEQNAKLKDLRAAQKAQQGAQNGQQQ